MTAFDPKQTFNFARLVSPVMEIAGQNYQAVIGSDLKGDGMFLEVTDEAAELVAVLFYSDRDGSMTLIAHRPDVPLPLIEWMIAEGRKRLPPAN